MRAMRLGDGPIIPHNEHTDALVGSNINGPSLIRVPDWLPNPLGRYYLYFAHHVGPTIRLAYADTLRGPWTIHAPGTLRLEEAHFIDHIASPDVHVDDETREIRMYYHGLVEREGHKQATRVALSRDGLRFTALAEPIGPPYARAFRWKGLWHTLGMPGIVSRSADGLSDFERGPTLFTRDFRHCAVQLRDETLRVFYTDAGEAPERIMLAEINLAGDWQDWQACLKGTVLEPEEVYEGADLPLEPSRRGPIMQRARQLRDPAIFEENERTYLLYSVAGERGIAIAELIED